MIKKVMSSFLVLFMHNLQNVHLMCAVSVRHFEIALILLLLLLLV